MEGDLEYDDTLIRPLFQSAKVLPYVYILASRKNGTLYVGVTSDLIKRIYDEFVKSHIPYVVHASTSSARTEYQ